MSCHRAWSVVADLAVTATAQGQNSVVRRHVRVRLSAGWYLQRQGTRDEWPRNERWSNKNSRQQRYACRGSANEFLRPSRRR